MGRVIRLLQRSADIQDDMVAIVRVDFDAITADFTSGPVDSQPNATHVRLPERESTSVNFQVLCSNRVAPKVTGT
jgi:hypothetical protein